MNNNVTTIIKHSLICAANYEVEIVNKAPDAAFIPSHNFERNIISIKSSIGKPVAMAKKRLIVALIAAALLLAMAFTAVAYRDVIFNLIESIFDDHNNYSITDGPVKEIDEIVYPSYVPDGYKELFMLADSSEVYICWENQNSQQIHLVYNPLNTGSVNTDTTGAVLNEFAVKNMLVKSFTKHSITLSIWDNGKYYFLLTTPEAIGVEELSKIIESIQLKEK